MKKTGINTKCPHCGLVFNTGRRNEAVVEILTKNGPMRFNELKRAIGMTGMGLHTLLLKLEKEGIIKREEVSKQHVRFLVTSYGKSGESK